MADRDYWAALPLEKALPEIDRRVEQYYQVLRSSRLIELFRQMHWCLHAGMRTTGMMGIAGDAGELTTIEMNEIGNLESHTVNLVTAQRPQFECQAINTDHEAQSQTMVGNAVLEYCMRDRDLERTLGHAVTKMCRYGEGWILKLWDALEGPDYRPDPESQQMVKVGDVSFHSLGPWDVARDTLAETAMNSAWHTPRLWPNRYDLMARYPEKADDIADVPSKYEVEDDRPRLISRQWTQTTGIATSDEVPLYVWLHRKCDALPDGRMVMYLTPDLALYDGPLPYRESPLYRMASQDVDGTTVGYTCLYDCLAPQQAINAVVSTITSNQAAFGVQNIWVPTGSNLSWKALRGGLNMVEGGTQPPQALNLLATKEETFRLFELLRAAQERYSGINSTVRGNPEASLKSGAALALVYAQTIQFVSLMQKAYIKTCEKLATATLHDYQDFGSAERTIAIAGEQSRPYSVSFTGEKIKKLDRVTVKLGNPLTGTIAGRYNLAEMLLQAPPQDRPVLMEVLNSGRLEPTYEAPIRERMLIRAENELLSKGNPVHAAFGDNPATHIPEHMTVAASPEARADPDVMQALQEHISEHVKAWRTTDKDVLMACGIPPPPMPLPPPPRPASALTAEAALAAMMNDVSIEPKDRIAAAEVLMRAGDALVVPPETPGAGLPGSPPPHLLGPSARPPGPGQLHGAPHPPQRRPLQPMAEPQPGMDGAPGIIGHALPHQPGMPRSPIAAAGGPGPQVPGANLTHF